LKAQHVCATPHSPGGQVTPPSSNPCFDVQDVFNNCTKIYIGVNLHFFVPNSCIGNVQQLTPSQQVQAFTEAEAFINAANNDLANTPQQWPQCGISPQVCVPIRYVLKGVYMHCQSGVSLWNYTTLQADYSVNASTEINVYVANLPGEPSGIANDVGGTYGGVENLSGGNYNHEIGHMLNLNHVELGDFCSDTDPNNFYHTWGNMSGITCWDLTSSTQDIDNDNIPDCQETPAYPCCTWDNINNNLMTGASKFQEALTVQQVKNIMLPNLANQKCAFIEQIGGTNPPPSAFINQTPEDKVFIDPCGGCLVLRASVNEVRHMLTVYEGTSFNAPIVYSTPWLNEPAKDVCYSTDSYRLADIMLTAGLTYRAVLDVEAQNLTQDTYVYTFVAPPKSRCSEKGNHGELRVVPNPTGNSNTVVEFNSPQVDDYMLLAVNTLTSAVYTLDQSYQSVEGDNSVSVPVGLLPAGSYQIKAIGSTNVYSGSFIKL
jgi:hypothetical protein